MNLKRSFVFLLLLKFFLIFNILSYPYSKFSDYKRVIIIPENQLSPSFDNAEFLILHLAIASKTAPIIVTRSLLYRFMLKPEFENILQDWYLFRKSGLGENSHYILVPRIYYDAVFVDKGLYNDSDTLSILGLKKDLIKQQYTGPEIFMEGVSSPQKIGAIDSFDVGKECDFFYFFEEKSGPWNIFMAGHGTPCLKISGLSVPGFEKFLHFLSKDIVTNFLFYITCFGGGVNLVTPYLSSIQTDTGFSSTQTYTSGQERVRGLDQGVLGSLPDETFYGWQNLNFIIAEAGITEAPVALDSDFDFNKFFNSLDLIFALHDNKFRKILPLWKDVFNTLDSFCPGNSYSDISQPLIRYPGVDFFQVNLMVDKVDLITTTSVKINRLNGINKVTVDSKKSVLLLYPPIIPITLDLSATNTCFKIILMNPEGGIYFFKEIESGSFIDIEHSLVRYFNLDSDYCKKNIFFVKKWRFSNGVQFSNVFIFQGITNRLNLIGFNNSNNNIFFVVDFVPDSINMPKYNCFNLINKKMIQWGPPILDKRFFYGITFDFFSTYLNDRRLKFKFIDDNLIAPWQENPFILAAFIFKELKITEKEFIESLNSPFGTMHTPFFRLLFVGSSSDAIRGEVLKVLNSIIDAGFISALVPEGPLRERALRRLVNDYLVDAKIPERRIDLENKLKVDPYGLTLINRLIDLSYKFKIRSKVELMEKRFFYDDDVIDEMIGHLETIRLDVELDLDHIGPKYKELSYYKDPLYQRDNPLLRENILKFTELNSKIKKIKSEMEKIPYNLLDPLYDEKMREYNEALWDLEQFKHEENIKQQEVNIKKLKQEELVFNLRINLVERILKGESLVVKQELDGLEKQIKDLENNLREEGLSEVKVFDLKNDLECLKDQKEKTILLQLRSDKYLKHSNELTMLENRIKNLKEFLLEEHLTKEKILNTELLLKNLMDERERILESQISSRKYLDNLLNGLNFQLENRKEQLKDEMDLLKAYQWSYDDFLKNRDESRARMRILESYFIDRRIRKMPKKDESRMEIEAEEDKASRKIIKARKSKKKK